MLTRTHIARCTFVPWHSLQRVVIVSPTPKAAGLRSAAGGVSVWLAVASLAPQILIALTRYTAAVCLNNIVMTLCAAVAHDNALTIVRSVDGPKIIHGFSETVPSPLSTIVIVFGFMMISVLRVVGVRNRSVPTASAIAAFTVLLRRGALGPVVDSHAASGNAATCCPLG